MVMTKRLEKAFLVGLLGSVAVTLGCTGDEDGLEYLLRMSLPDGEPPENEEIGILINVQAGIFGDEGGGDGVVELAAIGGTLQPAGAPSASTRACVRVPIRGDGPEDAAIYSVVVVPEGRSSRVFALLWGPGSDAEDGDDGCPQDFSGRELLDSAAAIVPPDESEPDEGTTTASTESGASTGSASGSATDAGGQGGETSGSSDAASGSSDTAPGSSTETSTGSGSGSSGSAGAL